MTEQNKRFATIPEDHAGLRLDRSLAQLFPEYSRARIQAWIVSEHVTVDGEYRACKYSVSGGEHVELTPIQSEQIQENKPEDIALDIMHEDDDLLVINKPVGLVVHPGAGNSQGTLMNALLFHSKKLANLPRAGIVHRLDKDTSGLMVVAKSIEAHTKLVKSLQEHKVIRKYYAIVRGQLISGGSFDEPIGRHPHDRTKMAISEKGKEARTHFIVKEKFKRHTLVEVSLETGRTHQIRVHFAANNYPLVGDSVYAPRVQKVANVPEELNDALCKFPRQALHAFELSFDHPISKRQMTWRAEIPGDMQSLLNTLREYSSI